MKRSLVHFICAFVLIGFVTTRIHSQTQAKEAVKFDEFGDILSSDLMARLDNFSITLKQQPSARGFIMVYRTRRDLPGLNHSLGLRMQEYLVDRRGLPKNHVVIVDGGVADCLVQELWVVPPGTAPRPRDDARIGLFQSEESAWKFSEYGFLPAGELRRFDLPEDSADHLEVFANEVKKRRNSRACIIVYAQYNPKGRWIDPTGNYEPLPDIKLDPSGVARRRLQLEKQYLMKEYGIAAARIHTIDGGYRKQRAVELWVVPAGEPFPIPTPNSFPPRAKK